VSFISTSVLNWYLDRQVTISETILVVLIECSAAAKRLNEKYKTIYVKQFEPKDT